MANDEKLEPYSVFSARQKITIVGLTVVSIAMVIALPVNVYYPALNAIKEVIHVPCRKCDTAKGNSTVYTEEKIDPRI